MGPDSSEPTEDNRFDGGERPADSRRDGGRNTKTMSTPKRRETNDKPRRPLAWSTRAIVLFSVLALAAGVASATAVYSGIGTGVTLHVPSVYSASSTASANFPTAPTIAIGTNTAGGCASTPNADAGFSSSTQPLNATTANAHTSADCVSGDWTLNIVWTSSAAPAVGSDTFQIVVTWTGCNAACSATNNYPASGGATETISFVQTYSGTPAQLTLALQLDFGSVMGPGAVASVNVSVSGT